MPQIGEKARDLVRLAEWARSGAFEVPEFRLLDGITPSSEAEGGQWPAPATAFPGRDDIVLGAQGIADAVAAVTAMAADAISTLTPTGKFWLRSSFEYGSPRWSLAGANRSAKVLPADDTAPPLSTCVAKVVTGHLRAYNHWYHEGRSLAPPSMMSVIVSDNVDSVIDGTLTVMPDGGCLDFGRPKCIEQWSCRALTGVLRASRTRGESLERALDAAVRTMTEFFGTVMPAGTSYEVEFSLDSAMRLVVYQARPLYAALGGRGDGRAVDGPHHTPGEFEAELVSLLEVPRTQSALRAAIGALRADAVYLVNLRSDRLMDAFALLWAARFSWPGTPLRVAIAAQHDYLRNHLVTAALEDPGVAGVVHLDADVAALAGARLRISSDGVACRVRSPS